MRKWEEIVPEEDRRVYAKGELGERRPFGNRPGLLIVDVVESWIGSKRQNVLEAIEEYRTACGEAGWEALPRIRTLLHAAREAEIPVVFTKGDPNTKAFCGDSGKGHSREEVARLHSTNIPDIIAPLPTEFVLRKTKASAFFGTPLPTYFHSLGVDSLLVCGTSTSGCVRASAVDAHCHGYTVFVVEDCCFDRSQFFHLVTLFDLNAKYADVITLEEAVDSLRALKGATAAGIHQRA